MTDHVTELTALGAATLGEAGGYAMRARIKAAWSGARVCGPAYCAKNSAGDNLAIHQAAAIAPVGSVIVASVGDVPELGYWGEVLTTAAQKTGVVGLVIDGGVRDVDALRAHNFPAFSTMIALRGASKNSAGEVGGTVTVGDVDVHTGDWIVGDVDGVVVIRANELDDVLARGRARAAKETEMFTALNNGATTLELLDLDEAKIGIVG